MYLHLRSGLGSNFGFALDSDIGVSKSNGDGDLIPVVSSITKFW